MNLPLSLIIFQLQLFLTMMNGLREHQRNNWSPFCLKVLHHINHQLILPQKFIKLTLRILLKILFLFHLKHLPLFYLCLILSPSQLKYNYLFRGYKFLNFELINHFMTSLKVSNFSCIFLKKEITSFELTNLLHFKWTLYSFIVIIATCPTRTLFFASIILLYFRHISTTILVNYPLRTLTFV